jgi:hypothetical protein
MEDKKQVPVTNLEANLVDCFYCGLYVSPLLRGAVEEGGVGFGDVVKEDVFLWCTLQPTATAYSLIANLTHYGQNADLAPDTILANQKQDIKSVQKIVHTLSQIKERSNVRSNNFPFSISLQPTHNIKDLMYLFSGLAMQKSGEFFFHRVHDIFYQFPNLGLDSINPTDVAFVAGWKLFQDETLTQSTMSFMIDTPTTTRIMTVVENGLEKIHVISHKQQEKDLQVVQAGKGRQFISSIDFQQYMLQPIEKKHQMNLFSDFSFER